jgi:hypothetical protein
MRKILCLNAPCGVQIAFSLSWRGDFVRLLVSLSALARLFFYTRAYYACVAWGFDC